MLFGQVTMSYVVPPIVMFLNKHPLVAKADLSSLNRLTCGAAALGREMIEEFRSRLPNCDIGQGSPAFFLHFSLIATNYFMMIGQYATVVLILHTDCLPLRQPL